MRKEILRQFLPVAEGIAKLLSPYAEVIIHDLETQKILHIINAFSKREKGYPSNLEGVDFNTDQSIIGPYQKTNWDCRKLKSISVVLKDPEENPVGLLCINLDVSMGDKISQMITGFIAPDALIAQPEQLFKDDWHEKVNAYSQKWAGEKNKNIMTLKLPEKKELIRNLYSQGAFNAPKSPEYVAGVLGLGRATIFKYLKEIKGE